MPKYLIQASYTSEGSKGLAREGGSSRRAAVEASVRSVGGKVDAFYYAFGETDAFVIIDLPDNASAAALSFAVNQSGSVRLRTTVLLTLEEVDQAVKRTIDYRPPGR
jgi:uncharacterized protein with GYD domain